MNFMKPNSELNYAVLGASHSIKLHDIYLWTAEIEKILLWLIDVTLYKYYTQPFS